MFGFVARWPNPALKSFHPVNEHLKGMHEFPVIAFEPLNAFDQLACGFLWQRNRGWRNRVSGPMKHGTLAGHVEVNELVENLSRLQSLLAAESLETLAGWRLEQRSAGLGESPRGNRGTGAPHVWTVTMRQI